MKQFKTVFKFELNGMLKNKGLLITTAIMSIASFLIMTIPTFMIWFGDDGVEEPSGNDIEQVEEEGFSIVYESDELAEVMGPILGEASYSSEKELVEAVENEEVDSGFIVQDYNQYKYVSYDRALNSFEQFDFDDQLRVINERYLFAEAGLDSEKIYEILNAPIETEEVFLGKDAGSGTVIAFAIIFILYMLILLYGNNVATSVAREKDSRTMELLITSTKPKTLILGKVAAVGLTGIIQIAVMLLFAALGFFINKGNYPEFLLEMVKGSMTIDTIFVYVLFSVLGYTLYLFIFASLGSLVSKVEDVAKSTAPITYLFILAYLAATFAMQMPDNSIIKITSFIPFVSMFTMPIRYMMTTVPLISIVASSLIMILTVVLFAAISCFIIRIIRPASDIISTILVYMLLFLSILSPLEIGNWHN